MSVGVEAGGEVRVAAGKTVVGETGAGPEQAASKNKLPIKNR
jgi:hypothetical protein